MKRFILLIAFSALVGVLFSSCKQSLPEKFDSFVTKVEKNCAEFSQEDWTKANEQFEQLFNEFNDTRSSLSSEEIKQINKSMIQYGRLAAKAGIGAISDKVQDFISDLPAVVDGVKSLLDGLGLGSTE